MAAIYVMQFATPLPNLDLHPMLDVPGKGYDSKNIQTYLSTGTLLITMCYETVTRIV